MNPKNTTILPVLIALILGSFALSPQARAVCQDACLTNNNTVQGDDALISNTGSDNTATGFNALYSNTTGSFNTANGSTALTANTSGGSNAALGDHALAANTTGGSNTASGSGALGSNTTGFHNTASGYAALYSNTLGFYNTATGATALFYNTTGGRNTATGYQALVGNMTGHDNTATGLGALQLNKTGFFNTASGQDSLNQNLTGAYNVASGVAALFFNKGGDGNTADGAFALYGNTNGRNNTANGWQALLNNTTGGSNVALGSNAGKNLTTGSNNIDIGNAGVAAEANTIRIGTQATQTNAYIAGISGATVTGTAVVVNSSGQLGVAPSSQRFKEAITPMKDASEAILSLRPVTFRYNKELDPEAVPQFGLVAEEVEKVNPDLVARDEQGKPYTVRYEAVNAMLLNEFLKEHRKVEELEANATEQQKQIEALTAGLQKVSAQLEVSKSAPQTVLNNY